MTEELYGNRRQSTGKAGVDSSCYEECRVVGCGVGLSTYLEVGADQVRTDAFRSDREEDEAAIARLGSEGENW